MRHVFLVLRLVLLLHTISVWDTQQISIFNCIRTLKKKPVMVLQSCRFWHDMIVTLLGFEWKSWYFGIICNMNHLNWLIKMLYRRLRVKWHLWISLKHVIQRSMKLNVSTNLALLLCSCHCLLLGRMWWLCWVKRGLTRFTRVWRPSQIVVAAIHFSELAALAV